MTNNQRRSRIIGSKKHPYGRLKLQNFKAFGDEVSIDLRPITLVFGANSSGKSSILHALIYLHHMNRQQDTSRIHDITYTENGGSLIDLGGYPHYIFQHNAKNTLRISLDFLEKINLGTNDKSDFKETQTFTMTLTGQNTVANMKRDAILTRQIESNSHLLLKKEENVNKPEREPTGTPSLLTLEVNPQHPLVHEALMQCQKSLIDLFWEFSNAYSAISNDVKQDLRKQLDKILGDSNEEKVFLDLFHSQKRRNSLPFMFDKSVFSPMDIRIYFDKFSEQFFNDYFEHLIQFSGLSATNFDDDFAKSLIQQIGGRSSTNLLMEILNSITDKLIEYSRNFEFFLSSLMYLGPIRTIPSRLFNEYNDSQTHMSDGSRAWHRLAGDKRLVERLNTVLTQLEISYALRVHNPADMLQIHSEQLSHLVKTLQDTKTTQKGKSAAVSDLLTNARSKSGSPYIELVECKTLLQVSHRDVGIGISQVLPILASCYGDRSSTICIEQPELHLHPRLQGNLADVFIETSIGSKQNNTYIIETHSEHIIRRLMRRVREGKISKDDISIVYVESGPNGSTVTPIRMDDDGDLIDEWPNGFFEEGFRDDMAGR